MRQSEAVNKIAISKKVGGNFDARLAITTRAVLAKDNTTAYDPDNMSASLAKLLTASDSGSQISGVTTGTDLTSSTVLTTLATNVGAHDTQGVTLMTALKATTGALTSLTLVTPVIGVATGTSLAVTGLLKSSGTAGVGYATGAGGVVTQGTDRSTGVTLSKISGQITTNNASLAAAAFADFTVTNTLVAATDVIVANIVPGGTGSPRVSVVNVAAGSFKLRVTNDHASTADTSADVINFAVIKAVAA